MPFSWDSIVSFFSPPASRNTSPSLFSSPFSNPSDSTTTTTTTKQTDLPMPPTSAFTAAAGAPPTHGMPSPAESSSSLAASDRDYFPPTSSHRRPSMSSTSTTSTDQIHPHHPQRTHTTPPSNISTTDEDTARPPAPHRAATTTGMTTGVEAPLDPLSRSYPKPAHEPSLDELLARAPLKWSLGHYVKNARERKVVEDPEERARRFEEAKMRLLRDKERIDEIAVAIARRR